MEKICGTLFSMWRIESVDEEGEGSSYVGRAAAVYDRLVRSRTYNRIAWSTDPADYSAFAAEAIDSADGPLLEAAAGSAAATAHLHARSGRPTVLVDLSAGMLERAARGIAAAADGGDVPAHVRLVRADVQRLPLAPGGYDTVLGLGLLHLFDDVPALVAALAAQLAPGGRMFLAGLVPATRRGRRYLDLLHRAGEVAAPRTAAELGSLVGPTATLRTVGCMAYLTRPQG